MYLFVLECTWYFLSTLGLSTSNILNSVLEPIPDINTKFARIYIKYITFD